MSDPNTPELSLTDLVDIVSKSGLPKANKVRQVKHREDYSPATDFYKKVRGHIANLHEKDRPRSELDSLLANLSDPKKVKAYREVVDGYKKWWGRKKLAWFKPPHKKWTHAGVSVRVNPELGLQVNGVPHLVKLYFKSENLAKNRVEIIAHLMGDTLRDDAPEGAVMSILDVRNAKLHTSSIQPVLTEMLKAELAYVSSYWPSV